MKEIKYIFNGTAIIVIIASLISFIASIYFDYINDRINSVVTLEFFGVMFFIGFVFAMIGISTKDWVLARVVDYYSSLSLLLQLIKKEMRVLIKKRTRLGHQEKNKTRQWKVSEVPYKTFKTFLIINLIIGELYYEQQNWDS